MLGWSNWVKWCRHFSHHEREPQQMRRTGKIAVVSSFITLVWLGISASYAGSQVGQMSQLSVQVDGLKNQQGQICLNLFASSQGFPSNSSNALQSRCVAITARSQQITFNNLRPGSYAVAVLHDTNGDRTINSNFLGIPIEGFGFSGNPVIRTGPPEFRDAVVFVAGQTTTIQIRINYL